MAAPAARLAALTMAKLVLSSGGSVVFQCFVDKERLGVGRDPTNQIVVDDPSVSREHAAIVPVGNDHILEDLASANGTFVNGTRMSRRILQHGDVVEFGAFHLRYLNLKTATEVDLDRTMLIEGIAEAHAGLPADGEALPVPRTRATRIKFPNGRVHMFTGPRAGTTIELDRVVARFGKPATPFGGAGTAAPRLFSCARRRPPRPTRQRPAGGQGGAAGQRRRRDRGGGREIPVRGRLTRAVPPRERQTPMCWCTRQPEGRIAASLPAGSQERAARGLAVRQSRADSAVISPAAMAGGNTGLVLCQVGGQ